MSPRLCEDNVGLLGVPATGIWGPVLPSALGYPGAGLLGGPQPASAVPLAAIAEHNPASTTELRSLGSWPVAFHCSSSRPHPVPGCFLPWAASIRCPEFCWSRAPTPCIPERTAGRGRKDPGRASRPPDIRSAASRSPG